MNSTVEKNYRSHQQIVSDVLTITQDANRSGIAITVLCQKANQSHSRLRNLLTKLTGSGLINTIKYDGKNTFVLTEKGAVYLEKYKQFTEYAEGFGLEM